MMLTKLGICIALTASTLLWCVHYASRLDERMNSLERARRFVLFVRREIDRFETALPEIERKFAAMENTPPEKTAEFIEEALENEDKERFHSFYTHLGASFASAEVRLCDECDEYFSERIEQCRAQFERKRQTTASLAMFAALCVCILIL